MVEERGKRATVSFVGSSIGAQLTFECQSVLLLLLLLLRKWRTDISRQKIERGDLIERRRGGGKQQEALDTLIEVDCWENFEMQQQLLRNSRWGQQKRKKSEWHELLNCCYHAPAPARYESKTGRGENGWSDDWAWLCSFFLLPTPHTIFLNFFSLFNSKVDWHCVTHVQCTIAPILN